MFPDKKINLAESLTFILCLICLLALIIFEFKLPDLTNKYPLTFSNLSGIFSGILSAIALLFFQQKHHEWQLSKYYTDIAGQYTRIDIGQDNSGDAEIKNMKEQNIGLPITLIHIKGTHSFKYFAAYWRNQEALVEGIFEFDEKNGTTAYGRYRYTKANDDLLGHSGTYRIFRLEEDKTKLLVQYHHLFPRRTENNPDANRGWEIWQKT
jgi:hypothetical protein